MGRSSIGLAHYIWFASVGTALVLSIIALCVKEYIREWKHHQAIVKRLQVKDLEEKIGAIESELPVVQGQRKAKLKDTKRRLTMILAQVQARPTRIQQIQIDDLNRVDRCTTCHLGIEDEGLRGQEQPYGGHLGRYLYWHDIDQFGCTVCHEGQGLSTDYMNAAHRPIRGLDRPWQKAVLPKYMIQSSCGKCHLDKEVPFAPILSKGRDVIEKAGCSGCHKIRLYEDQEKVAPSLDGLGSKVNRAWLLRWLIDPREYDEAEELIRPRMPRFNLSKEQILDLEAFLMTSKSETLVEPVGEGNPERGGLLFRESRCVTCHRIEGKGGYLAPELSLVTTKASKNWIYNWIKDPHYFQPRTKMPQFAFSEQQILDIVSYIWEEFEEEVPELPEGFEEISTPGEDWKERIARGKKVFMDYGCTGCHTKSDIEQGKIAPELLGIGSKDEEGLLWGELEREDIDKYIGNWIYMRLKDPDPLEIEAKMPDFSLTEEEMAAATAALLSDTGEKMPSEYTVFTPPLSYPEPPGEFKRIIDRYRCRSCHVVYGKGGWVSAHPLDREGSEVKKEWLRNYFDLPYSLRPILKERMLNLRMSPQEADFLTEFMTTVMVDNSIPDIEGTFTDKEAVKGRELFEKYGCKSCHILGKGGGYVGPPLTNVGNRLTAGWAYVFLKNPQYHEPWSIQPDYNLSDEDAWALTAYLMTCREEKTTGRHISDKRGATPQSG
ncbi:MAG: c-type cytochrome [Candidatus Brocadiales bacterium]